MDLQQWLADRRRSTGPELVLELDGGRWLRLAKGPFTASGYVLGLEDVTDWRAREQWLLAERRRLQAACDGLRLRLQVLPEAEARCAEAEARLGEFAQLAHTDALTGLLNRRRILELADAAIGEAKRHGRPLAALMLDLDHFKAINDRLGHQAGDNALQQVARLCADELRDGDLLARWGGEELFAVLPGTDGAAAERMAERLRHGVERLPPPAIASPPSLTVSIGVAELAAAERDITSVITRADAALYAAKRRGRNQVFCKAA